MPKFTDYNQKVTPVAADQILLADSETVDDEIKRTTPTAIANLADHTQINNRGTNTHAQIDTHIADTSLHISPFAPENTVIVDASATELTGQIYNTWSSADTYVQTQTPSASNRWSIIINGINTEAITVRNYVSIIGTKGSTELQGELSTAVSTSNSIKTFVSGCTIKNVTIDTGSTELILHNCDVNITTESFSDGSLEMYQCDIYDGTYNSSTTTYISHSNLFGGTYDGVSFYNCDIDDVKAPTQIIFGSGTFNNCRIIGGTGITWSEDDVYLFIDSNIDNISWTLEAASDFELNNCLLKDSTVNIAVVPTGFSTIGCVFNNSTITGAQVSSWSNTGIAYDNSTSSLSATDTQAAIDEIVTTVVPVSITSNVDGFELTGGTTPRTLTVTSSDVILNQDLQSTSNPTFADLSVTTINNLTPTSQSDGFTLAGGTSSRTLTITGSNVSINQDLQTTSSPTFVDLSVTTINDLTPTSQSDGFTLAGGTSSRTLTVTSADVTLNQSLQTSDDVDFASVNDISLTANVDGFELTGGTTPRTFTISGNNITLNQDLQTTSSPTFAGLTISGAQIVNFTTVNSATYNTLTTDYIIHVTYTTTGECTITIPSAQISTVGRTFIIKDAGFNASTYNIIINTEGSETIEGQTSLILNNDEDTVELYSDGSNLFIGRSH